MERRKMKEVPEFIAVIGAIACFIGVIVILFLVAIGIGFLISCAIDKISKRREKTQHIREIGKAYRMVAKIKKHEEKIRALRIKLHEIAFCCDGSLKNNDYVADMIEQLDKK